jgi:FAD:protein FMN transferase
MSKRNGWIVEESFEKLGTAICLKIVVYDNKEGERAKKDIEKAKEIYQKKGKIFSRFDETSELSKLNQNLGVFQNASPDILQIAEKSLYYYKLSDNLFDPRVIEILECIGYKNDFKKTDFCKILIKKISSTKPKNLARDLMIKGEGVFFGHRMDFSGIAKGYITDKVSTNFKKQGWKNFVVDSGGDMYLAGTDEDGECWTVEIEGVPQNKLAFDVSGKAVATSGISRRKWEARGKKMHHLINPKDPQNFSFDMKSVTIIEENCERADVLAKTLFLMGKERGLIFSKKNNIKSIFLDYKGNVFLSPNIKNNA